MRTVDWQSLDDADRRVAIADDVDQTANGLIALVRLGRQQTRLGKCQAQMNQNRRALGEHAAIGQLQGRDLLQGIELRQILGGFGTGFDINEAKSDLTQLQRRFDGGCA